MLEHWIHTVYELRLFYVYSLLVIKPS